MTTDHELNRRSQEQSLVKLSAENLLLRQRMAQLDRENKQLRQTFDHRNQVIDVMTLTLNKGKTNV